MDRLTRRRGRTGRRRRARAWAFLVAVIVVVAVAGPGAGVGVGVQASVLPPLPLPVPSGISPVPPLPSGGNGTTRGTSQTAPAPPRPSRSPPSRCADQTGSGPIAFIQPVFPCDFPDPMVLRAGGAWFAYASATGWEQGQRSLPILRSTDLRHWRFVGDALSSPPSWSSGDLWGPSVLSWRGRYLLFYNARLRGGQLHCLVVATAAVPQGPFQTRRRLACHGDGTRGYIDPAPLIGPKHQLYLFFSVDRPQHSISVLRLRSHGLRTIGRLRTVLKVSPRWGALASRTIEGPWPLHRHGFYYLFYSAGAWNLDYRMAYAVARSPLGPYSDSAPVPILSGTAQLPAPGGGSVLTGPGGSSWLAFAAWSGPPGYALGSQRTMRIAPLRWTPRGVPQVDLSPSGPVGSITEAPAGIARLTPTR
jgi:xylan 1,4-beta-xylosidase